MNTQVVHYYLRALAVFGIGGSVCVMVWGVMNSWVHARQAKEQATAIFPIRNSVEWKAAETVRDWFNARPIYSHVEIKDVQRVSEGIKVSFAIPGTYCSGFCITRYDGESLLHDPVVMYYSDL